MHHNHGIKKISALQILIKYFRLLLERLLIVALGKTRNIKIPLKGNAYALIAASGLFDSERNYFLYSEWNRSHNLADHGKYHEAIKLRVELLSEIYLQHGCDQDFIPRGYDSGFFTGIGHWGVLGLHVLSSKLNLIPFSNKVAVVPARFQTNAYIDSISDHITFIPYKKSYSWTQNPMNWHFFERLEMFRAHNEFVDQMLVFQKFADLTNNSTKVEYIQIKNKYREYFFESMKKYGLSPEDKFVALHIRENDNQDDPRNVSVTNYIPLIKKLLERGYKVIRYGTGKVSELPHLEGFVQLSIKQNQNEDLHTCLIENSTMHVDTLGGPSGIAWTLGVPTLHTNCVTLGYTPNFSHNAIIPKKFWRYDLNREVNLDTVLGSGLAYQRLNFQLLKQKFNVTVIQNSPLEIERAGIELLNSIEKKSSIEYHPHLKYLYESHQFPFQSKIPLSFLELNEYLLS